MQRNNPGLTFSKVVKHSTGNKTKKRMTLWQRWVWTAYSTFRSKKRGSPRVNSKAVRSAGINTQMEEPWSKIEKTNKRGKERRCEDRQMQSEGSIFQLDGVTTIPFVRFLSSRPSCLLIFSFSPASKRFRYLPACVVKSLPTRVEPNRQSMNTSR